MQPPAGVHATPRRRAPPRTKKNNNRIRALAGDGWLGLAGAGWGWGLAVWAWLADWGGRLTGGWLAAAGWGALGLLAGAAGQVGAGLLGLDACRLDGWGWLAWDGSSQPQQRTAMVLRTLEGRGALKRWPLGC